MINIAFDEGGNTGDDLLHSEQKVFTLASNNYNDTQLKKLFSEFDSSNEAHFVKLRKSNKGRNQLLNFLNHELITEENIFISACNKEFALIAQLVDQIYEPYYHNSKGIDIYSNNFHIALTNFIYYFGNTHWDRDLFIAFLRAFMNLIRTKDKDSFISFGIAIDNLKAKMARSEVEVFMFPLLQPETFLDEVRSTSTKFTLDFTLSLFLTHCDKWHKKSGDKLSVLFDNSKQIEHYKEYIDWVRGLDCTKTDVGFGDKTMTFPAQIDELRLIDSKEHLSVQCSDILASTIAFYYNNTSEKQEPFREEIRKSKLFNLKNYHNVWPSLEDLKINESSLSGSNILDFLSNFSDSFPEK